MKINDRIVGAVVAGGLMAVIIGAGAVSAIGIANTRVEPTAVVETSDAIDLATIPDGVNGLAVEQEAEAAAVEAQRVAAEAAAAEAARVAAEQAAAAEAERIAAEQAAAEAEPETVEPAPADDGVPEGAWPLPWIPSPDPVNAPGGGRWDMSNCFGHGETINGVNYCVP